MASVSWEFTEAPEGERTGVTRLRSFTEETGKELFVNPAPVAECREAAYRWLRRMPETRNLPEIKCILDSKTNAEIMMGLQRVSDITEKRYRLAIVV